MHILIAVQRPTPPLFFGGVEVNTRLLCEELVSGGHSVSVLGCYTHPRWQDNRLMSTHLQRLHQAGAEVHMIGNLDHGQLIYDWNGTRCLMTSREHFLTSLATMLSESKPDLVVTTCAGARAVVAAACEFGIPSVAWVQDVGDDGAETAMAGASATIYVSRFLRDHHRGRGGPGGPVVPPPFPSPGIHAPRTPSRTVLMINPIKEKGIDVLLALTAVLPEVDFIALSAWRQPDIATTDLPRNLRCFTQQSAPEQFYLRADLVIVPSRVVEGFGRVPVEAALLGKRALCIALGGLPEASGVPENLLPNHDFAMWAGAVRNALEDQEVTARAVLAAKAHARRFVRPLLPEILDALSYSDPRS